MKLKQNDLERIENAVELGRMTIEQANVEIVLAQRVRIVTHRMPRDLRKTLNATMKRGELCHVRKDGDKPEAYYHPDFEHLAKKERNKISRESKNILLSSKVLVQ